MRTKIFAFLFFLSFVTGQLGRWQFGSGISVTLLDLVVCLFVLSSVLRLIMNKNIQIIQKNYLFLPLSVFFVACIISLAANILFLQGHEAGIAALYLLRFFFYASLFLFFPGYSQKEVKLLLSAVVFALITTVFVGFIQFVYYPNLGNLFYLGWDDHLYRLFSVFLDPNFAGVLFSFLFLYLLNQSLENKRKKNVYMYAVGSALSVLATFLTYSRTGMISIFVGTVTFLLLKGYKKFLFGSIIAFLILLVVTSDVKVEGLNPFRTASSSARIESIRIALSIFTKDPILGVGFNAYRYAQHRYGFRPDGAWDTSHADSGTDNSFLFVLATTGIVGLGAYLFFCRRIYLSLKKTLKKSQNTYAVFSVATFLALVVSSIFLDTLFYPFVLVWVALVYSVRGYM